MRGHLLIVIAVFSSPLLASQENWVVTQTWSSSAEQKFREFIEIIGDSNCNSLNACLTSSSANPFYIKSTPILANKPYLADCADLPFALRMYFAWMEELPFDYVNKVSPAQPNLETSQDIRYTKYGNKPDSYRSIQTGKTYNGYDEMIRLNNSISTAMYRMHYDAISDFFPPAIDPSLIRPGTVVYDPAGHAAIIYKIEDDGRIKMMDAHPDQSITRITFDKKFVRSRPAHGAGFKNWRPELNTNPTASLPGFSTEEYNPIFDFNGKPVDYYDYVRIHMAGGHLKFNPINELQNSLLEICSNINDRTSAVNAAIQQKIDQKPHPLKLPENIYGTSGEWEDYSTPSRDARLKVAFVSLHESILRYIQSYQAHDSNIEYTPSPSPSTSACSTTDTSCFLIANLIDTYQETVADPRCQFTYTNSNGSLQNLDYHQIMQRLFKLSFDPYDCIELRWGAEGNELSTCQNDTIKMSWYAAEQRLRNQTERTYDAKMDFDVTGTALLGVAQAPSVDLLADLKNLLPPSTRH